MGFGWLLGGYFAITMMSVGMGEYSFAAYLLGGMLCGAAAYRLKAYNPRFVWTVGVASAYILLGLYQGFAFLDNWFYWGVMPVGRTVEIAEQSITLILLLALHVAILWAVAELANHLGLVDLKSRAIRNAVYMGIYGVGEVVILAVPAVAQVENQIIPRLLLLYLLLGYILNAWLLWGCYQNICPAGEEHGTPTKRSRFAWVNRLNDKFDERSEKALREKLDYAAERRAQRAKKKKKK